MTVEQLAVVCHEANRAYCKVIGDNNQPPWEDAPKWQRDSARNGVLFHLNNPDASPSQSHDEWLKEKTTTGWTYGPVKDTEKKKHPCCVSYDALPDKQKAKDLLFRNVICALRDKPIQ